MSDATKVQITPHSPEGGWLLDRIDEFTDAGLCGDDDRKRDVFLQVVNRCAQLGRWADAMTPDHLNVPADNDPCWATPYSHV